MRNVIFKNESINPQLDLQFSLYNVHSGYLKKKVRLTILSKNVKLKNKYLLSVINTFLLLGYRLID